MLWVLVKVGIWFVGGAIIVAAVMKLGCWVWDRYDSTFIEVYEPDEPSDVYEVIYRKDGQTFRFSFYDHQRWEIWMRVMDYAANDDCVLTWYDVAILRPKIKPWQGRIDRGTLPAECDNEGGF